MDDTRDKNLMEAIGIRKEICYLQGRLDGLDSLSRALREDLCEAYPEVAGEEMQMGIWMTEENLASLLHTEIEEKENKIKELVGED
jgi:hypothetical protein